MNALAPVLSAAMLVAAAESPFVGTWKLNPAKSQFTGTTVTYEQLPAGEMRVTEGGQSYNFKPDGKEYPAVFGMTAAWKQLDPNTWEVTLKVKDRVLSTDTIKVSADDKTLTVNSKGRTPDGTPFDDHISYQRVSGGPGLAGKWKSTKVTISSPQTLELSSYAGDGLSWKMAAFNATANMKFDGKDNPVEGPTVPPNFTIAATSTGPRSFELVEKMNGKIVYRGTYTLSDDGKTLTAVFSPEGASDKVTAVYDRQ
jgi:hypothetical protein